jgi:chromosome segregation ATPase
MKTLTFALMLFAASDGLCQTPRESDTLQSLLAEVHQLRQDIEAMTVASQRVQIALYVLQMQNDAVTRAAQRLDAARSQRTAAESARDHTTADIQRMEGTLASRTLGQPENKEVQEVLADFKRRIETQTAELQTRQLAETEASSQLRNEQAKLDDLQDRVNRLDKTLEKMSAPGK